MKMKTKYTILSFATILFVALFIGCSNDDFEGVVGVCPVVLSTNPEDGAINVPLDQTITVLFNEDMDPSTFTRSSFFISGAGLDLIPGDVSLSGATASFRPTTPLTTNTTYTAIVKTSVKDRKGNALQEDYIFTFSTGLTLIPMVTSTDPTNLATDVFLNKTISASFNMLMDPTTINTSTFTLKQGTTVVVGGVTYSGQKAFFKPTSNLLSGTEYTATITTGTKNVQGTALESDYTWRFTTGNTIAPTVISTDPINNASGVALDKIISAVFSEGMNPSTINTSTFTLKNGTTAIAGAVTYSGQTAFFNPTSDLSYGTEYTATITTGAKNIQGIPLVSEYTWKFTAGAIVAPTVISTDPIDNATGVPLDKIIAAVFSVAMDPTTINASTFTLKKGTTVIAGAITYSGRTAFFNPTSDLLGGTEYTATITTGAKNIQGIPLASSYAWKFTTGTTIAPRVTSTDPINNATGVALDKVIATVFSMTMDPTTINSNTFTLKNGTTVVVGAITYSGQTAYFNPNSNLLNGTEYTATITTGAKNLQGIPLESDYIWKFTAGTVLVPSVISTDPINNAINVALDKIITADFSMPMDPTTINSSSFTLKKGATLIPGVLSYSGVRLSFNPTNPLLENTIYTATITTDAKSIGGIPLANNYVWSFKTLTIPRTIIDLQTVARFGIIAGLGVSNNAGFSEIRNLDVGIYPGVRSSITGFPPAIVVNGAIYASDDISPPGVPAMLLQAKTDLTAAYLAAEGATVPAPVSVSGDQGGLTLAPGIYKSTSTLLIQSGDLTLDAQGDPNASWIFQIASDFTTVGGAGGNIILAGGAKAKNIFWQVGSSATIGDYTIFKGNILALTSVTMNSHAVAEGRMLCINGAVVMTDTNIIAKPVN